MRDHVALPDHPLTALLQGGALAVVTAATGGYRMPGTMMAVSPSGATVGALSGGCIEADVAIHAQDAMQDGRKRVLRYGEGSPFADLRLPCGGMLEVTVVPHPDPAIIAEAVERHRRRLPFTLWLDDALGFDRREDAFAIPVQPEIRFAVLGTGVEAEVFANTARGAGYDCSLDLDQVDAYTAITLFFHDHDREIPLLLRGTQDRCLLFGAQGSRRAAANRAASLLQAGVAADDIQRIHGPFRPDPRAPAIRAFLPYRCWPRFCPAFLRNDSR